ncbi:MAG TPA: transcription antitermination factor NusB [Phycisphaerae bacterium]|nr:transcription antitermination factor NusB [Phycisphaerae bacterium]
MALNGRELAYRTLVRWSVLSDPPFLPERSDAEWQAAAARERAFGFELLTGVMRRRGTLDAVVATRLRQPLESVDLAVRALLWIGAYQLLLQGGTAAYAAVDSTVELAKSMRGTARAAGLVNAVLRGIARLHPGTGALREYERSRRAFPMDFQTAVTLSVDVFPNAHAAPEAYLAATLSHPEAYVRHLRGLFGERAAAGLLLRNNLRPVITLRADREAVDVPAAAGLAAHGEFPRFLVALEGWNAAVEGLVDKGVLSPQDPTAAKPVRRAAELSAKKPPERVLDLCAGLGTKTVQLARAFPQARVTATDVDGGKLSRLAARVRQIGQGGIETAAPATLGEGGRGFDLVLVDVPCSNTGVMGKRVQSRWRWPTLDHAGLHGLQRRLLEQGAGLVAPGGMLVYGTCSIDPAENERVVEAFAEQAGGARGFVRQAEETTLPALTNDASAARDGGYYCILTRAG